MISLDLRSITCLTFKFFIQLLTTSNDAPLCSIKLNVQINSLYVHLEIDDLLGLGVLQMNLVGDGRNVLAGVGLPGHEEVVLLELREELEELEQELVEVGGNLLLIRGVAGVGASKAEAYKKLILGFWIELYNTT